MLTPAENPAGNDPTRAAQARLDAESDAARNLARESRAERLRTLGQMTAGVAHDLRQVLALIAAYADMGLASLAASPPDVEGARKALELMAASSRSGSGSLQRILTFARHPGGGPADDVDVGELLQEVSLLSAPYWRDTATLEGRHVNLRVEAESGLTVRGSSSSLTEVLLNLVINAVDALPDGGDVRLSATARGEDVVVEVADTGTGIALQDLSRIFDPFFTTKGEHGTGLGLAQVLAIVQEHAGRVDVDTRPGRGTTFRLTFPRRSASQPAPAPLEPPEEIGTRRVLIVDDEAELVRIVCQSLRELGHTAAAATSGREALDTLQHETFDIVVSDLTLGEGMNGWDLADEVRAHWPSVPFILATAWGPVVDPNEARTHGVAAIVSKPYRVSEIERLLLTAQLPAA